MTNTQHALRVAECGVTLARGIAPPVLLETLNRVLRARVATVMAVLGDRPIGIGSREGYHECVQRSPGRFDIPLAASDLATVWGAEGTAAADVPWLGMVREILGHSARPSFCGVVFSKCVRSLSRQRPPMPSEPRTDAHARPAPSEQLTAKPPCPLRPGSPAQQWHIDSPHEAREHRDAHAVNVLLPLAEVPLAAGPTEVAPGSHFLTNHLRSPGLDRADLLYQTATEVTPAALLAHAALLGGGGGEGEDEGEGEGEDDTQALAAGDALIFDDRALHRGLANCSASERYVAYFSYARPRSGAAEDTHFEAVRSLFD